MLGYKEVQKLGEWEWEGGRRGRNQEARQQRKLGKGG